MLCECIIPVYALGVIIVIIMNFVKYIILANKLAVCSRKVGEQQYSHANNGDGLQNQCQTDASIHRGRPQICQRTALQKNVRYARPILAKAANTKPKRPCVANLATFSTKVTALSASALCASVHISVMTPLAAGADPDPNGSRKAAAVILAQ